MNTLDIFVVQVHIVLVYTFNDIPEQCTKVLWITGNDTSSNQTHKALYMILLDDATTQLGYNPLQRFGMLIQETVLIKLLQGIIDCNFRIVVYELHA